MSLDPAEVEQIAARVAELLRHEPPPRFIDAATLARELSVERDWVYEHAAELGAIRLGGVRGRLRFDRRAVCGRLAAREERGLAGGRKPARPLVGAEPPRGQQRRRGDRHRKQGQMPTRQRDSRSRAD